MSAHTQSGLIKHCSRHKGSLAYFILTACILIIAGMAAGCGEDGVDTTGTSTTGMVAPQTPVPAQDLQSTGQTATEQESPYGSGLTSPQTVGTILDGVQLLDVRWADHGSYFRIVFDMGTSEGVPMLQIPHAEASLEEDGTQLRVLLGGIRSISDKANAQASELSVGNDLVTSIRRIPSQDDQALLYVVDLSRPATYALAGVGSPGRIVIDIMKG